MEIPAPRLVSRTAVRAFRWSAHGLDRAPGSVTDPGDVPLLDAGVQDTGPGGAGWALALRGFDAGHGADLDRRLALAWTLRGAPHAYRRADLAAVAVAVAPFDEADAAKRVLSAARPLREAGIDVLDALRTVARLQREIVVRPTVKGNLSTALTARLEPAYLHWCPACKATHSYEMPFHLAALHAGLELAPGTSPPVLARAGIAPPAFARLAGDADPRLDAIRGYLRFHGPATVQDVARYLDAPVRVVRAAWPADVEPVSVEGQAGTRWLLAEDVPRLTTAEAGSLAAGCVRLLGPYDPYLQLRDRATLVPDVRAKALWPSIGRPGAVAADGEVVGVWRPRTTARTLTVRIDWWTPPGARLRAALAIEAERLAAFRGLARVDVADAD